MSSLHIFLEEPSAKNVLKNLIPKIVDDQTDYHIYQHQGKQDLHAAIQKTIPSISKIPGAKIIVAQDQDSADCMRLKEKLVDLVRQRCKCSFKVRIICRELEAWFLGDMAAIQKAYKRFKPEQYKNKALYRNVDHIQNPDHELLKIIPEFKSMDSLPKLKVSTDISNYMDIEANTSMSFRFFVSGLKKLLKEEV